LVEVILPRSTQELAMNIQNNTPATSLRQRMTEDMVARNLGPHSQRNYLNSCARFAAFLGRSPEAATADDIRRFQLFLIESGASIVHRNRIMTGVKFLLRVTLRRHDLAAEIYQLKEPQKIPLVMSQDEVKRLLAVAASPKVRAMLSLAYGCGLRTGEVVRLRVGDIDSAQNIIRVVQSKGRKDRNVMLPADILGLLRQWWRERPTRHDTDAPAAERWLFPGCKPGRPLTTRQLIRLFHATAAAAGITKPVTPHSLRHSFATHLLERGVDIRVIQALLGHDKLETTALYTRVATGMISAVDSPLDDLSTPRRKHRKAKNGAS
jgi:site-specific recombinase XerD